jgi:transcriptional regulator with XRE-family HTH domain
MKHLRSARHDRLRSEIAAVRRGKGIAQHTLSAMLGHSPSFISKIEAGERRLDVLEFSALCEALGEDPADILRKIMLEGEGDEEEDD